MDSKMQILCMLFIGVYDTWVSLVDTEMLQWLLCYCICCIWSFLKMKKWPNKMWQVHIAYAVFRIAIQK